LIGTKDYTSIGRRARVYATVAKQVLTDKVLVFKKKRRRTIKGQLVKTASHSAAN